MRGCITLNKTSTLSTAGTRCESRCAQVLIVGDLNVASERIDVHPRIKPPEKIYTPEERALLAALLKR